MQETSIPLDAIEQVTLTFPDGTRRAAEYFSADQLVGRREFYESGGLQLETSIRNGRRHGMELEWNETGRLVWRTQYVDGLEHGTATQWDEDGRIVGSYTLELGTGLDLWWTKTSDRAWTLAEARWMKEGDRYGFEWWINEDQRSVSQEGHFWAGREHGILREWSASGRLRRGYPRYYVHGERVVKRQYLRAAERDATLPPFQVEDNEPPRRFPPEVEAALRLGP